MFENFFSVLEAKLWNTLQKWVKVAGNDGWNLLVGLCPEQGLRLPDFQVVELF